MINKKDFEQIRNQLSSYDLNREKIVKKSRDIIRLSKQIIYSIHRNELKTADPLIKKIKAQLKDLEKTAKTNPRLLFSGSYKVAEQEAVEAIAFYSVVKDKKLPTRKELEVNPEHYLLGVIDLTGELVRKAVNSVTQGDFKTPLVIKELVHDIYHELQLFDFTGELRKKSDGVKYDVKKLEDLALQLKLKEK